MAGRLAHQEGEITQQVSYVIQRSTYIAVLNLKRVI
jgi:hypothetical protein